MKPRNKFQQKAVEASKKLPPLTPAQERWAYTKVIESVGQRTRKVSLPASTVARCSTTIPNSNIAPVPPAEHDCG